MRKHKGKLVNKVKYLLRKAAVPRWLHHYGPKKYEFWHHALALLIKQECRLGYRRVSSLMRGLGYKVPTYSALAKMAKRIPLTIWQALLSCTVNQVYIAAIDGSGMSRPLPSPYYYKRIDKPYPVDIPLKISIATDTRTKKILAIRLRAKNAHDIRDAKYLIKRMPRPRKLVADKAYDANWLHEFCHEQGIISCIPERKYHGTKHPRYHRRIAKKDFHKKTYGRREMVEAAFAAFKRKFGASVSSLNIKTQRTEIYCRAIAHNIMSYVRRLFQLTRRRTRKHINQYIFMNINIR
jgi:hypothetical protein